MKKTDAIINNGEQVKLDALDTKTLVAIYDYVDRLSDPPEVLANLWANIGSDRDGGEWLAYIIKEDDSFSYYDPSNSFSDNNLVGLLKCIHHVSVSRLAEQIRDVLGYRREKMIETLAKSSGFSWDDLVSQIVKSQKGGVRSEIYKDAVLIADRIVRLIAPHWSGSYEQRFWGDETDFGEVATWVANHKWRQGVSLHSAMGDFLPQADGILMGSELVSWDHESCCAAILYRTGNNQSTIEGVYSAKHKVIHEIISTFKNNAPRWVDVDEWLTKRIVEHMNGRKYFNQSLVGAIPPPKIAAALFDAEYSTEECKDFNPEKIVDSTFNWVTAVRGYSNDEANDKYRKEALVFITEALVKGVKPSWLYINIRWLIDNEEADEEVYELWSSVYQWVENGWWDDLPSWEDTLREYLDFSS